MAVTSVVAYDTWLEPNAEGYRVYKKVFHVYTDSKNDGPITVRAASGLPDPGDAYTWGSETDTYSTCDPIPEIRLMELMKGHYRKWSATFNFTNEPRNRCQDEEIENPTLEPWDIEGDGDDWEKIAEKAKDADGNGPVAITNSALEPFETRVYHSRRKLILRKNYTSINQDWIEAYTDSVNQNAILIFGKNYGQRSLLMRKIHFTRKRWGTCTFYYPVTFNIDIDPNKWDIQFPDKGYRKKKSTAPNPPTDPREHFEWICEGGDGAKDTGRRVREMQYLDGSGLVKTANEQGKIEPTILTYRYYSELDWSVFGFPSTG